MSKGKVCLAYSGGLDTSCILKYLIEEGYEVVCFMADVGQEEDFEAARAKALQCGALKCEIVDIRREFIDELCFPAIACNAVYENVYLLGTSLARPVIARAQIEVAQREGCFAVSHGCTGKGNDQVRFELAFYALQPTIKVIAPWRDPVFYERFAGRNDLLAYAAEKGIPVTSTKSKPWSMDENLAHCSYEAGILEDPDTTPPADMWKLSADPLTAPDQPEDFTVHFEKGIPVKLEYTEKGQKKTVTDSVDVFLTPTQVVEVTEIPTTEAPTTKASNEPQTTKPAAVETTTAPSLRTQEPEIISDAVTNDAANTQAPGYLSQGTNPLVLVVLAGICCIFLFVWGRKRRSSLVSNPSKPGGTGSKGPKVQYTPVPDEQPFSHSQDDDDEYCDDYEEDSFANDRDNWDDWEGNSTQNQASQLNPFVAPPAVPRPTIPRQSPISPKSSNVTKPLTPSLQQQQHLEIAIAGKGDLLPSRSVESNSSSDSFEVVTDEAHVPHSVTGDSEKEESIDDLFSQFGMVPTFKKSVVVLPPPAAKSAAPASQLATASSASSLPTAAEASALFAAELDDELTAVDAADEWGEDDEWVKGI